MAKLTEYQQIVHDRNFAALQRFRSQLPYFTNDYFTSLAASCAIRTQAEYAADLVDFFSFLVFCNPDLQNCTTSDVSLEQLAMLRGTDINEYTYWLTNTKQYTASGIKRKFAALNRFFNFMEFQDIIEINPLRKAEKPKKREIKENIHLDADGVKRMRDSVIHGETLTRHRRAYHNITWIRDNAIVTLMLFTGIRVSECVGMNMDDIDLVSGVFRVIRKGHTAAQSIVINETVYNALAPYIEQRKHIEALPGHEKAVFLSMQKKRMCVKAVENMVKKYATDIAHSDITAHRLRATFATALYEATKDVYLVAEGLGHSPNSLSTTARAYAFMSEERKRTAYTTLDPESTTK